MRASVVFVLLALSFPCILSKLEDKLTKCGDFFFEGESPAITPGILENSEPQTDDFRGICQKYENKIRYATLYDTRKKIPVFSAYKYTGTNEFTRPEIPQTWMIELELEPKGAEMREPFVNQARNKDYWIKNPYKYIPGTLFPMSHAADEETAESSLTLTNGVPQTNYFRDRIWNLVEQTTKEYMDNNCRENNNIVAYVLTGVIPGNTILNKRVNVPSHTWTAFCCYNSETTSWVSKTYFIDNKHKDVTKIKLKSLIELQEFLNETLGQNVELFKNHCGVDESQFRHWILRNRRLCSRSACFRAARRRSFPVLECCKMHAFFRRQWREQIDPSLPWLSRDSLHTSDDRIFFSD